MKRLLLIVLALATLQSASTQAQSLSVGWKPPLVPLTLTVSSTGELSVSLDQSIQTPIGTFTVSAGQTLPIRDALVVVSKGVATAYRTGRRPNAVRIPEGTGQEVATVDANGNTVVTLAPSPYPGYERVPPRLRKAAQNATYSFPDMNATEVTLRNGTGEGKGLDQGDPYTLYVELRDGPSLVTDLNGDGTSDIVVVAYASTGGSGTFRYLFPLILDKAGHVSVGIPREAGDRSEMRSLSKRGDTVVLDYVTQGPDDPMCCPTLHALRSFRYSNGRLVDAH